MEAYFIVATSKSPEINFATNGEFTISGNSYMEDPIDFYSELADWLKLFLAQTPSKLSLNISLKYINSTSRKAILNIINLINECRKCEFKIVWVYQGDDDEILELGQDFQKITEQDFEFRKL
ncbi:MAG: DUF1987 domain-containing protein [Bacteroidetes bacterium]|nr:DUF1987 domain-containing protein [Bacteroidota bacterium]